MNVIEKVLKAVAACPNCQFCPYEDFSTRYCGNCKELRRKDAETAKRLLEAIRRTDEVSDNCCSDGCRRDDNG